MSLYKHIFKATQDIHEFECITPPEICSMTYEATILQQLPLLQAELAKVRWILRDPLVHHGRFKGKILGQQKWAYPAW